MSSEKKLKLGEIKIQSFVTSLQNSEAQQKGQGTFMNTECSPTYFTDECCSNTTGGGGDTGGGGHLDSNQTCSVVCASGSQWSTCDGSCATDMGMSTCETPGQTGC